MPRASRHVAWLFTVNNPKKDYKIEPNDSIRYYVYQLEQGEEKKTPHIQGYITFTGKRVMRYAQSVVGGGTKCHMEAARGSAAQNRAYCTKEKGRLAEPVEYGIMPVPGKRTELGRIQAEIFAGATMEQIETKYVTECARYDRWIKRQFMLKLKRLSNRFRKVDVQFIWGKTDTGKTRGIYDEFGYDPSRMYKLEKSSPIWWCGYEGQDVLLIDDFYGWIKAGKLLNILDGYPLQLPVKGGHTYANWTKVRITSNQDFDSLYPNVPLDVLDGLKRRISRFVHYSTMNPSKPRRIHGLKRKPGAHKIPKLITADVDVPNT